MRIVDRKTFMTLPPGTIFAKIATPIVVGPLSVKADSIGDVDFVRLELANWQSEGSDDWADRYYQMVEDNVSVPIDDMYGRDGMFEKDDKFLIFERADLLSLRTRLDEALTLPDLPTPSRALAKIED